MHLIDEHNAEDYLRAAGRIDPREQVTVHALSGGVSNQVLYVARPERPADDFVLKQARPKLRTPDPWFASVERAWREVEVLKICQELLSAESASTAELPATTPRIVFEDRDEYLFAMSAAPRDHTVWKQSLLAGHADPAIATACGRLLGVLHSRSWQSDDVSLRIGDRQIFVDLRIEPYYRTLAERFPDAATALEQLIKSVLAHPLTLVHADFSPKNLLVFDGGLMMVDFEAGHFGDPAFDVGFFLSHLVLKAAYHLPRQEAFLALADAFWAAYRGKMLAHISAIDYAALETRAVQNFAGCAWARLDAKSRVEYLEQVGRRQWVRDLCRRLLTESPASWHSVRQEIAGWSEESSS